MCGICGVVSREEPANAEVVQPMCNAIAHRGPDDEGLYRSLNGRCVLGNRRLAIIDLSAAGHMPMGTDDGRFWITYNGELYNFRELHAELESRGHRFRSRTDTEVILRLYQDAGGRCVERLNGMFAFAIWDEREQTLFLARDKMGIKPLYYTRAGGAFLFASEIRALLATGAVERRVDPAGLAGYLMLGSVPDSHTIIGGVHCFPPAHYALLQEGRLSLHRYWSHSDLMRDAEPMREADMAEALRETLKDAVRRQMVSDAPLGLFLSGGMDSSTIAALTCALGHERVRSVSITFDEKAYDESEASRAVAERFGLDHVEYPVTAGDVSNHLDRVVQAMDQPSADAVNTYFVSKAAREAGLTVALSGLGADELFGGYSTFETVPKTQRVMKGIRRVPHHDRALALVERAPAIPRAGRKLARWMNGSDSLEAAYATVRGILGPSEVRGMTPLPETFNPMEYMQETVDVKGFADVEAVSLLESRLYMHNQLLRDTDAMSMAHSLEVRVPFLDDEVVAMAGRCRTSLRNGGKAALSGARDIYFPIGTPEEDKKGFSFPFDEWLMQGFKVGTRETREGGPWTHNARELLREYRAGGRHWSSAWTVAVLDRWLGAHQITA
ncbi:MAG: asparagine synthase (glutamine-hydrolyzing) [Chloroflexi bacterium]|nr:MAG: asparagine synthase (glutamine-hydrolyzing) [Chloroflexota bacterium]